MPCANAAWISRVDGRPVVGRVGRIFRIELAGSVFGAIVYQARATRTCGRARPVHARESRRAFVPGQVETPGRLEAEQSRAMQRPRPPN